MRTIEQVALDPRKGDAICLDDGKIRWVVRSSLSVPSEGLALVIADREEAGAKKRIAVHPVTWADLVRASVDHSEDDEVRRPYQGPPVSSR